MYTSYLFKLHPEELEETHLCDATNQWELKTAECPIYSRPCLQGGRGFQAQ